ncbi:hypothetical protein LTS15_009622 [Exophiala xenobiotica]|nr:hypothetical protein LTS15_009622 [Exophiala xenobiotica]
MAVLANLLRSASSSNVTSHIHHSTGSSLPLEEVRHWTPNFKVDALGIIALLGQSEVNRSVGRLVRSKWLEYLPLIGSITFASDEFTEKQPGFQLYNIDDDIYTPDVAGWLTRWLMAQDFRTASTCVEWSVNTEPINSVLDDYNWTAIFFGILLHSFFIVWTVLTGDWWGLANALSMTLSTLTRAYLLDRNRTWLDEAVVRSVKDALQQPNPEDGENVDSPAPRPNAPPENLANLPAVRLIVIMSDAKAVAIRVPKCLVRSCFVLNPRPYIRPASDFPAIHTINNRSMHSKPRQESRKEPSTFQERIYTLVRWVAWVAFAVQVVSIGMSDLATQLLTVAFIGIPTFALVKKFGCNDMRVGRRLTAKSIDFPHPTNDEKRMDMYAFLELNDEEKEKLERWNLVPSQKARPDWWTEFNDVAELYNNTDAGEHSPLWNMETFNERDLAMKVRKEAREMKRGAITDRVRGRGQSVGSK